MSTKLRFLILAALLFTMVFSECAFKPLSGSEQIRVKGSDTMKNLMENLARVYMESHPRVSIYVEGGGTGSGVNALIQGKIDICSASRPIEPEEVSRIAEKYKSVGIYSLIARDALSIYTNPANPVTDLTLKQLKQIFTGEITNWSDVGGKDMNITVLIRPSNSGTNHYFREHILENQPYTDTAKIIPTTNQIVDYVRNHPDAIGYGGIAFGPDITHCKVNGINPSVENVRYDLYPISRYLYLYTVKKTSGKIRNFIDWISSKEGQKVVEETGFISLWPDN